MRLPLGPRSPLLTAGSSRSHRLLIGSAHAVGMRPSRALIASAALVLVVAACDTTGAADTTVTTHPHEHDHSNDHNMGDPDATPADQVSGADLTSGRFAGLEGMEASSVSGEATMARHDGGTTVTIELHGLEPDTDYISHVHAAGCSEAGGPHYKYDPNGGHHPPNEIHLAFTTSTSGHGFMTVENHQVASSDAVSVVIHEASPDSPKVACADLGNSNGSSTQTGT